MGGAAAPRGAALAARFATEYNVVHQTPEDAGAAHERIAAACADAGRDPATMTFSLMHGFLVGADEDDLRARGERLSARTGMAVEELRGSWLSGTPEQLAARLREYEAGGRRARDAAAPPRRRPRGARADRVGGRPSARVSGANAFTGARLDRAGRRAPARRRLARRAVRRPAGARRAEPATPAW